MQRSANFDLTSANSGRGLTEGTWRVLYCLQESWVRGAVQV
jgi:hypothetical protein